MKKLNFCNFNSDCMEKDKIAISSVTSSDLVSYDLNQEIWENLKILNYEKDFCDNDLKPIHSQFFVVPQSNPAIQFRYFAELVSWLFLFLDLQPTWTKYDDPTSICSEISQSLRQISINIEATRCRTGYGETCCLVLVAILREILQGVLQNQSPKGW